MLDRKELKEIAQVQDAAACCVSLYLNVSPVTNPKGEFIIQFKNMVKKTVEGLDKNTLKIIKPPVMPARFPAEVPRASAFYLGQMLLTELTTC